MPRRRRDLDAERALAERALREWQANTQEGSALCRTPLTNEQKAELARQMGRSVQTWVELDDIGESDGVDTPPST